MELSYEGIKNAKKTWERYRALNLSNSQTVEFRIFKGTLDFTTFMAAMELVDNIVDIAKKDNIDGLTWNDIIVHAGNHIVDYANNKNIKQTDTLLKIVIEDLEEKTLYSFKIGDVVVAKKSSNGIYFATNYNNRFVGKVVDIINENEIWVSTIKCKYSDSIGSKFLVNPKYFKLAK